MSDQGNGQWPQQPDPQNGQDGQTGQSPQQGPGPNTGGHRLPGGNTGGQQVPDGNTGAEQAPGGDAGGQWTGGQQPWSGQQPWASGGQDAQPPSWSTGQTGPNVGPTMNNPQSSYYDRFSEASGEGLKVPQGGGGGGRGKVLLGLAAALVLIIAAVAIFAFTRGDDSPKQAAGSSSTGAALAPVKATTWTNPTLAVGARALKSGWQAQQADDRRGVYDVPKAADWKLGSSDTFFGYANPKSGKALVISKAPAQYGVGFCSAKKTAESAWLGLVNVGKRDPSDAGPDLAQKFADAIALKKDGSSKAKQGKLSAAKQIKVDQGTIPALQYTITTAVGDPDDCDKGKQYEIRTVTFSSDGKSYQLVSVRMKDGPKDLSTKTLDEIFTTFRPSN